MRVTIPYEPENGVYLEVDIEYEVIATGGPPEPPFDAVVTGWSFVERWHLVDDKVELLDSNEDYVNLETGNVESPYDDFIVVYINNRWEETRAACRDFELTRDESMV